MSTTVLLYLNCGHVMWMDDFSLYKLARQESPPYWTPCTACGHRNASVILWEERKTQGEADLHVFLDEWRAQREQAGGAAGGEGESSL